MGGLYGRGLLLLRTFWNIEAEPLFWEFTVGLFIWPGGLLLFARFEILKPILVFGSLSLDAANKVEICWTFACKPGVNICLRGLYGENQPLFARLDIIYIKFLIRESISFLS